MSAFEGPTNWWAVGKNVGRTHISTKGINQSGLIMNLDAGSLSSYSGSGTTWTSLTGSNNGTLVNGPFYSSLFYGNIGFDGTNDYMTSTLATTSGQAVTYEGWLYSIETTSTARNFVDSGSANPRIWWNTSGQIEFDSTGYTTTTVYRNQWVHVALSKPSGSSAASYYVNGQLVGTGSAYTTPAVTPTWFNVAGASTWKGKCAMIHVYNRALSAAEILTNYNATRGRFTGTIDFSFVSSGGTATGGTITDVDGYRYHTFTSSNTLTVSAGSGNVEYAIVAGGGGGGTAAGGSFEGAGGGGAGGMLTGSVSINSASSPYTITIGAGGAIGTTGSNSSAFSLTANGGGYGGGDAPSPTRQGGAGGSGGGGYARALGAGSAGGAGTSGQGNAGGTGLNGFSPGGGGGGKNSAGTSGGTGGSGALFGSSYYAGGGGGGTGGTSTAAPAALGGGGVGQTTVSASTQGDINTGGGGGGGKNAQSSPASQGAAGGSGIVIIRYPL